MRKPKHQKVSGKSLPNPPEDAKPAISEILHCLGVVAVSDAAFRTPEAAAARDEIRAATMAALGSTPEPTPTPDEAREQLYEPVFRLMRDGKHLPHEAHPDQPSTYGGKAIEAAQVAWLELQDREVYGPILALPDEAQPRRIWQAATRVVSGMKSFERKVYSHQSTRVKREPLHEAVPGMEAEASTKASQLELASKQAALIRYAARAVSPDPREQKARLHLIERHEEGASFVKLAKKGKKSARAYGHQVRRDCKAMADRIRRLPGIEDLRDWRAEMECGPGRSVSGATSPRAAP